ncbi:MAG: hypothetical protein QOJ60_2955 [Actinomycetota bacterium]|nr:hypothetical protein [Actinomycetota bacterium]
MAVLGVPLSTGVLALTACASGQGPTVPSPDVARSITVTSPDFGSGQPLPARLTCRGAGTPPTLAWTGLPARTRSVAVVVSDPDAPHGPYVHWVVYDLPAADGRLEDGAAPPGARVAPNSAGHRAWAPPCPPTGTHHYRFTVYAVDDHITVGTTDQVFAAIGEGALARGTLTGTVAASP